MNTCAVVIATHYSEAKTADTAEPLFGTARCWSSFQRRLKELVTGDIFSKVITVAIFINILTMAVEHHNQPQVMTTTLQICNILFTALFFLEMMLKMIALGWTYFQDWSNIFDFAIVIIRPSVIRAFRALRLGRLMHFVPYLHRQLLVLKRTLEEAAMLCWLLLFGIFLLRVSFDISEMSNLLILHFYCYQFTVPLKGFHTP
ncbi:hypothetical protein GOODEAATRI_032516 [Goodea atripinnis]|uniref:Ion transport domain-containing protein n=1 Tax=Goodea atripinnis TaxID=208336 RepID=A0ABV0MX68_9TELE